VGLVFVVKENWVHFLETLLVVSTIDLCVFVFISSSV